MGNELSSITANCGAKCCIGEEATLDVGRKTELVGKDAKPFVATIAQIEFPCKAGLAVKHKQYRGGANGKSDLLPCGALFKVAVCIKKTLEKRLFAKRGSNVFVPIRWFLNTRRRARASHAYNLFDRGKGQIVLVGATRRAYPSVILVP